MRRALRWIGFGLGGLLTLVILALLVSATISGAKLRRSVQVTVPPLTLPTDSASLADGEYLVRTRGCSDCHGADLAGDVMVNDAMFGRLYAPNLTTGAGGIGAGYSDEDFARAVWYGRKPDGRPLLIMPANDYHAGLDADHLARMLAYIRSVPAIDRETPNRRTGPMLWVMHAINAMPLVPADLIDAAAPPPAPIEPAATAEYGATIATLCSGCHGAALTGMADMFGSAPNITPHQSGIAGWTEDDFVRAMREGVRPDGSALSESMPWQSIGQLNDRDLEALWAHLSSLEPLPSAVD
jgi:cytochrome c553